VLNLNKSGSLFLTTILCWAVLADTALSQTSGHRVSNNQVIISGRNHWQNWLFPSNTLLISPSGEVSAKLIEKKTNAVTDIVEYLRYNPPQNLESKDTEDIVLDDAISGGSNVTDVFKALDGDMSTYWQPAEADPDRDLASQWYFVIDLGRIVFAEKLVVRFVEEDIGDPFSLFEVLISDGQEPAKLKGSGVPAFSTVLRTLSKNKSQRVFEIDLSNQSSAVRATPVRFVQLLVTNTEGDLAHEVSQEEYESDLELQGKIQYYKKQPEGGFLPVDKSLYDLLEEDRKGGIRFFRKELPRLAEIEVWNEGDELISGILSRGGTVGTNATQPLAFSKFFDGKYETFNRIFYGKPSAEPNPDTEVKFDLGAFYWIDSYRISFNGARTFDSYRLDFSDGTLAPDGSLQWITKADISSGRLNFISNTASGGQLHDGSDFDPIKARFARLQWNIKVTGGAATADVSELQFYGAGYQPQISMVSDLIRLGGSRNLLSIEWDADTPPGTKVNIQTRTGNELGEILHYFNSSGIEVSEAAYGKLLSIFKGEIVAEQVAGSDWSDWSEYYADEEGSVISSPSPREFLMVRATLESSDPEKTPLLRSIRLRFSSPVAQRVVGEISPSRVEQLASDGIFSLYVKPDFARNDNGFDELLLVAPSNMALSPVDVFGGRSSEFENEGLNIASLEDLEILPTGTDSLHIRFARVVPRSAIEVLRLDFRTSLYLTGAVIKASLRNTGDTNGGSWQRVDPGNAVERILGNTTTIVSSAENNRLLTDIVVEPNIFSPNGDDVNDLMRLRFNVVRVGDDSPAVVSIYDLDGRLIQTLSEQREFSSGQYSMSWNGRNFAGDLVPPGNYLIQIKVDTDTEGANVEQAANSRVISLVY